MYLESSLILNQFSKMIVVDSSLGPMNSPSMGSWSDLENQIWVSFCEIGLKYNKKAVDYPHNIYITIMSLGMFCQARNYYISQGPQLAKRVDDFSPLTLFFETGSLLNLEFTNWLD